MTMFVASVPSFSKTGQTVYCNKCHAYPPTLINATVDKTSVAVYPDRNFTVTASYTGGANDGSQTSQIAWLDTVADNALFGFDLKYSVPTTSPTDSLTSTITVPTTLGNYTIRVYATSGSWDQASKETDYEDVAVTVKVLGDIDGDGDVDPTDFWLFAGVYPSDPALDPQVDLDFDGDIDPTDFWLFAGQYPTPYTGLY